MYEKEDETQTAECSNNAQEQMLLLFDNAPICCKLWNREMKIILCNQECVRLFGTGTKEYFMENFFRFSPEYQPDGRHSVEAASDHVALCFEEGRHRFEWLHHKLDGTPMPCEITMVKVKYDGAHVLAAYIRDLTEEKNLATDNQQHLSKLDMMYQEIEEKAKQLEAAKLEAESASTAKTSFLANMSHEMRTPLNVVIGLTDLHLEDSQEIPKQILTDLNKINIAGNTLLGIVNDVLDISKIEAGKVELAPDTYSSASLFNDIVTLNMLRIEGKPIKFNVLIDENVPHEIYGDELRLNQIFNNLLSNAFKYTQKGSVTLQISCQREGEETLWLDLSVSDTGMGMKQEALDDLFTEYFQVDAKANRKIEGTGLGLPITKRLIEMMDGIIAVDSQYGKGTTFKVRVKQAYVESPPLGKDIVESLRAFTFSENRHHVSQKLIRDDLSYAKILVVDDYQTNLDVTAGMLKKYKSHVDCVLSGQAAINKIKAGTPIYDAIFMDHMMPLMDGVEAAKRIRALGTEYAKNVPIIALTANAIVGNEQMFLDHGFQAFLSKPIDILKLDLALRQWVRDKDKEVLVSAENAEEDFEEVSPEKEEIHIPGLDVEKALVLYGDDSELYISIIESFFANTPSVIEDLKQVDEQTIWDYAIHVHGLKGACANVGASALREKAAYLEQKAKEGNLYEVLKNNPILLKDVGILLDHIGSWLATHNKKEQKENKSSIDKALLLKLKECCLNYDMVGADQVMEEILGYDYHEDENFVLSLEEKIVTSEFEEIVAAIDGYLEVES